LKKPGLYKLIKLGKMPKSSLIKKPGLLAQLHYKLISSYTGQELRPGSKSASARRGL
jgi:hypothetical protein